MKLEKFKEKDNKKKITIGISIILVLLIAGIIVYRSFAFYEEKKAFDMIKGQVPDQNYDLKLSFYVDNNYQETMPEGTNYTVSVTCSDGAKGEWDYEVWGPVITNLTTTRTKCKIYFKEEKIKVGDYVSYTPSKTSYTTSTSYTGYSSTQTIKPSELNLWRVIQITDEGIEVVSEYVSSVDVTFYGQTGYQNFVGYLNVLASQYETERITVGSRYLGYNGQTEYITDTSSFTSTTAPWTPNTGSSVESKGGGDGLYTKDTDLVSNTYGTLVAYKVSNKSTAKSYWLASRNYGYNESNHGFNFRGRYVDSNGSLGMDNMLLGHYGSYGNNSFSYGLRPIVIVPSSLFEIGKGTIDNPWKLS